MNHAVVTTVCLDKLVSERKFLKCVTKEFLNNISVSLR